MCHCWYRLRCTCSFFLVFFLALHIVYSHILKCFCYFFVFYKFCNHFNILVSGYFCYSIRKNFYICVWQYSFCKITSPVVVEFYSSRCSACKNFEDTYEEAAKHLYILYISFKAIFFLQNCHDLWFRWQKALGFLSVQIVHRSLSPVMKSQQLRLTYLLDHLQSYF